MKDLTDQAIRILMVEDLPTDAMLAEREIRKSIPRHQVKVVETEPDFIRELNDFHPDIVISDFQLPSFDGLSALRIVLKIMPEIPVIILTGSMNEDTAVDCMKAGATDYVIKEHVKRLGPAILNALEKKEVRLRMQEARRQLVENEERFRRLVENAQDLIYRYDLYPARRFSFISRSVGEITGLGPEHHYANPDLGFSLVHPDDLKLLEKLLQEPELNREPIVLRWIRPDGSIRWTEHRHLPVFDEEGRWIAIEGVARDITSHKREEKIQQILYEISKAAMTVTALEELALVVREELSLLIDTSNFFVALYDPERDLLRKVIYRDEKDDFSEWPAARSLSGQVVSSGKTIHLSGEAIDRFISDKRIDLLGTRPKCWLGVPLLSGNAAIGAMVVQSYEDPGAFDERSTALLETIARELVIMIEKWSILRDLTVAKVKAEESDRLKTAFLQNMSHEIRTPMNGILGFLELLREPDLTSEEKDRYIGIVEKSGERLLHTINDIIEISRIESGLVEVHLSEADIAEILQNHVDFFQREAGTKGLVIRLDQGIPVNACRILTDKGKLDGILINLINNALKFTNRGTIEIRSRLEGDRLILSIQDSGIGIPADRLDSIFNRFEQVDMKTTRIYEGSGLGLAIAKANAEVLDGSIRVESEPGRGSTFHVELPYTPVTS